MQILQVLRQAPAGLGAQELAERVRLHVNTVRFHLERLVADGVVTRHVKDRHEPGRPALVFTPNAEPGDHGDKRSYQLLAEILAGFVAAAIPNAAQAAAEVGRSWGRYLTAGPAPHRRATEDHSLAQLLAILTNIGFLPELAQHDGQRTIALRHCPFLEVALEHRDVVCSIHLGLIQGVLAEMRAPLTANRLEPLVGPSLCIAHLADVQ